MYIVTKMFKNFVIFFSIFTFLNSCSSSQNDKINNLEKNIISPEEMYLQGMENFYDNNFLSAEEVFSKLTQLFPISNEAIQAQIMIGFIKYANMDYEKAILQFKKIINRYPSHKDLDYIYYMVAMSNYEQITSHELDGKYNELSLEAFNQVIIRYPDSEYTKDSRQKIILVKTNKAAKHMEIGRFYLKEKKYISALNRFKIVIEEYDETKFTPEALHRVVEAYYAIGMIEEASKTASILSYNYPESQWYKYSYNLIKNIDYEDDFFKKITNFF